MILLIIILLQILNKETLLFVIHKPKEVLEIWEKKKCFLIFTINRIVDLLKAKQVKLKNQILIKIKLLGKQKNYFKKLMKIREIIFDHKS